MDLFYRTLGNGPPLVILHGLYGASDNWMTVGRILSNDYSVVLADLRNHGQSFHDPDHSYSAMSEDVVRLIKALQFKKITLLGHSMGGKVAMTMAAHHPELIESLVIVDIAPFDYNDLTVEGEAIIEQLQTVVRGLQSLYLPTLSSRQHADSILSRFVPQPDIRSYLLKGLRRNKQGRLEWKFNLEAIASALPDIMANPLEGKPKHRVESPTLFIKGALSPYLTETIQQGIPEYFKDYTIDEIPNAGHWPHVEQRDAFVDCLLEHLP